RDGHVTGVQTCALPICREGDKKDGGSCETPFQAGNGTSPDRFGSVLTVRHAATLCLRADVAELVDAHGSGPCGGNPVEVQVLSRSEERRVGKECRCRGA